MSHRDLSSETVILTIFLKAPVPGTVKTRLAARIGPHRAASLYTALLADTVTLAERSSSERVVFCAAGGRADEFLDPALIAPLADRAAYMEQGNGDLGQRLDQAMREASRERWLPMLILGSDSPDLPAASLEAAMELLERHDVVLGPASDGGVWAIGLAREYGGFFDDLPWSTAATGEALRNRASAMGLKLGLAPPWFDVDTPDDLRALANRLRNGESKAMNTATWLRQHGPEL